MSNLPIAKSEKQKFRKVRVWGKGQFTIPSEIRNSLGIGENSYLEIFRVGNAIIATPEKIAVRELADSVRKEMKNSNIDLEQLLTELREGNHHYEK